MRDIAVAATLRAAFRRLACGAGGLPLLAPDLRVRVRRRREPELVVLLVDASDSMGTRERIAAVRAAACAVLARVSVNRRRVAVVAFGGEDAWVPLPPTSAVARARECLERLGTGGATPLSAGLYAAARLIHAERGRTRGARLLLFTDGEANVPLGRGTDCRAEALRLAVALRREGAGFMAVSVGADRAAALFLERTASALGGVHRSLGRISAAFVAEAIAGGG